MLAYLRGGEGRPLLALHGNFASKAWWRSLTASPPAGCEVFAPDLPGFGDSAARGEPGIEVLADAVEDFIAHHGLVRPVLVGHSLGGAVALDLAARDPNAFAGLVLAASAPLGGFKTPEENYPILELLRTDVNLLEASLAACFPSARPANFAELVEDARRMCPEGFSGYARALERWSVEERAPRLKALVVGAELDHLITPEMLRRQAQALGTRELVLPGRGHGFPQEDPAGFTVLLEAFVQELGEPGEVVLAGKDST